MKYTQAKVTTTPDILTRAWEKVDDVDAGTDRMRQVDKCTPRGCKKYLFQGQCETDKAYDIKLDKAVIIGAYSKAVNSAVGVVCGNGPMITVGDDTVEFDKDFLSNVDGEGSTFEMYIRSLNRLQMHHGVVYCFIDRPGEDAAPGDANYDDHRPYLTTVKATQLTAMEHRRIGAVEVLTMFEWEYSGIDKDNTYKKKLHIVMDDDCDDESMNQNNSDSTDDKNGAHQSLSNDSETDIYSEYDEGDVVWTLTKKSCKGGSEVVTHGLIEDQSELPIVAIIGNKCDPYLGSPLFESVCDMNIDHYQMMAALRTLLHMTSGPMRVVSGMTPKKNKTVQHQPDGHKDDQGESESIETGPDKIWFLGNKDAKITSLETSGSGAAQIGNYLTRLEAAMEDATANFIVDRASVTATETVTKTIEVKSTLETVKDGLVSGLNNIIRLYKKMDGTDDQDLYVVSITAEVQALLDETTKEIIKEMFEAGIITKKGYAETMQQFLPDGVKLLGVVNID